MSILKSKLNNHFLKIKKRLSPTCVVSLISKLIGSFALILASSLLVYIFIIYPVEGDKASSLASMFGFAATLFAPIAALFLLDNWKEQTKYNALLGYIADIISEKSHLVEQLNEIRSDKDIFIYLDNLIINKRVKSKEVIQEELKLPKFNKIFTTLDFFHKSFFTQFHIIDSRN